MSAAMLARWSEPHLARVESALSTWVGVDAPVLLGDAMRYAVLDGGKRLRPLLVLAASEAVGGNPAAALRAACAAELIHAYSLVHDDLPCMDNDVLRRGKPTVHVKFGEADALLAGDALQALAFELLTPEGDEVPAAMQATLCRLLARAAGSQGMAGCKAASRWAQPARLARCRPAPWTRCATTAPRSAWRSRWSTTFST
jgi:farnesyl diphosphate synthase